MAKATTRKSTTKKTTPSKAAPKAAAKASPAKKPTVASAKPTTVVQKPTPVVAGPDLKKNEFIDRVVEASGMKRKDVKPIVEATLAELGKAIEAGEQLNVEPLGKIKVKNEKRLPNAKVFVTRLRRKLEDTNATPDPISEAAE